MFKKNNLQDYEYAASMASAAGVDIVTQNFVVNWDYLQSVFFATTILTTIGNIIIF